jgi:hypothetical protein
MKQLIKGIVLGFMIITALFAGAGLVIIDQSLKKALHPVRLTETPEIPDALNAQKISIKNKEDEVISALYIENSDSDFAVLFCHDGNGNLYDHLTTIETLYSCGVSVLAIDYRGFGLSDNVDISDETLVQDVIDGYDTLRRRNWRSRQIIFYSQGLFCGVLGQIVDDYAPHGWILENPVPSLQHVMSGKVTRLLTKNRLSLYNPLSRYDGRVFVSFDDGFVSETILSKMRSLNNDIVFCQISGEKTEFSDIFSNTKPHCIEEFISSIGIEKDSINRSDMLQ